MAYSRIILNKKVIFFYRKSPYEVSPPLKKQSFTTKVLFSREWAGCEKRYQNMTNLSQKNYCKPSTETSVSPNIQKSCIDARSI